MTENEGKTIVESLPEEAKSLLQVLVKNKMIPPHHCSETIGQSVKESILLEDVRDYVRMEYLILDHLLMLASFKVLARSLCETSGRTYDHVVVETIGKDTVVHMLDFYFDISKEVAG